jgi:hypothetical protein
MGTLRLLSVSRSALLDMVGFIPVVAAMLIGAALYRERPSEPDPDSAA